MAAQDYPIHYHAGRQGAPVLTGQVGTLENLFYRCIVDGFNPQTVPQGGVTRSGSTVTVSKSGHGFTDYDRLVATGANESEYNGAVQVLPGATSSAFQYTIVGSPNSPATGTMSFKFQPLGWTREVSTGNRAIFKTNAFTGSGAEFYLNDNGAGTQSYRTAFIRGCYGHTDIDTLTYPIFPNSTQITGQGLVVHKSSTLDATARDWDIYGNGRFFYLFVSYHATYPGIYNGIFFGDTIPISPAAAYPGCIQAVVNESLGSVNNLQKIANLTLTQAGKYMATGYNQTGDPVLVGSVGNQGIQTTMGQGGMPSPNPASNGYSMSRIFVGDGALIVGRMPGLFQVWHNLPLSHRSFLPEFPELPGRRIMLIAAGSPSQNDTGRMAFDLTGSLYD